MLSGLISTVRKLISGSYIDDNMFYCSPNNLSFQLVTGMTRIHSTLHVFSKIIPVTPFWPLVLVRKASFFPFQNFPIFIIKICRSACVHWTKVCLSNQSIFNHYFFPFLFRFAETESTAVLSMLVSQYKFKIKEEPQFADETFEERKSRILSVRQSLTLMYVLK